MIIQKIDGISDLRTDGYILIYNDENELIYAKYTKGQISTSHNLEVFNDAQLVVDKILELGLLYTIGNVLDAIEADLVIPDDIIQYVIGAFALALIMGGITFGISWVILKLWKKK